MLNIFCSIIIWNAMDLSKSIMLENDVAFYTK